MIRRFAGTTALSTFVLGFVLSAGCGTEARPPVSGTLRNNGTASGGGLFSGDGGAGKPPGCGTAEDGSQCDCIDVPLFVDPPTIYFVLDRSGSMAYPDKWNQVRVTVGRIMRSLGPRANFGAAMFPGPSAYDTCAPGKEIMPVRGGDPPSSGIDGPTTSYLLSATRVVPSGGTPTGPTLALVRQTVTSIPGHSYVILATDGAPNCNPNASCGFDECQPNMMNIQGCPKEGPFNCCEPPDGYRENCTDSTGTLGEISALKAAGIPVYVVGLPGVSEDAALLDRMAVAGGTALPTSPRYFAVDAASEDVMLATLKKVAAKITATCTFDLKEAPLDPSHVNVYMDDVILPYEPQNGWIIDGKTVTLVGSACSRVMNGDVLDVRIIYGCPRVEPK
ncbi:MAG TPA: vWA domain-containing protein [Labilithrix sp.]|nr:vWA domain-containing protein [Labilithrix sp.]